MRDLDPAAQSAWPLPLRLTLASLVTATATAGDITPNQILTASTPTAGATFGNRIHIDEDWLAIGADEDAGISAAGSVHVFRRVGSEWIPHQTLMAEDGIPGDHFGLPVVIQDDTMIIGSPGDDDRGFWSGSAYIYRLIEDEWTHEAKLLVPFGENPNALFGLSACFGRSTNEVMIGAFMESLEDETEGGVWIFRRSDDTWTVHQRLGLPGMNVAAYFGRSLDVENNVLAASASGLVGEIGFRHGGVALHQFIGDQWVLDRVLVPVEPDRYQVFGEWIDLEADRLAVGAPFEDTFGTDVGAVHLYRMNGATPIFEESFGPTAPEGVKGFGFPCILNPDGSRLLVGGYRATLDDAYEAGGGWIHQRVGVQWSAAIRLRPDNPAERDYFGISGSFDGDQVLMTAPRMDFPGGRTDAGGVLLFPLDDCDSSGMLDAWEIGEGLIDDSDANGVPDSCESTTGDLNGDGRVDGNDLGLFMALWGTAGQFGGDFDGDGQVNGSDLAWLLADWAA